MEENNNENTETPRADFLSLRGVDHIYTAKVRFLTEWNSSDQRTYRSSSTYSTIDILRHRWLLVKTKDPLLITKNLINA